MNFVKVLTGVSKEDIKIENRKRVFRIPDDFGEIRNAAFAGMRNVPVDVVIVPRNIRFIENAAFSGLNTQVLIFEGRVVAGERYKMVENVTTLDIEDDAANPFDGCVAKYVVAQSPEDVRALKKAAHSFVDGRGNLISDVEIENFATRSQFEEHIKRESQAKKGDNQGQRWRIV